MNNYDILHDLRRNIKSLEMRIEELKVMHDEDIKFGGFERVNIISEIEYLKDQIMMMNLFIKKEERRRKEVES